MEEEQAKVWTSMFVGAVRRELFLPCRRVLNTAFQEWTNSLLPIFPIFLREACRLRGGDDVSGWSVTDIAVELEDLANDSR